MEKKGVRFGAGFLGVVGIIMMLWQPEFRNFLLKCVTVIFCIDMISIALRGSASIFLGKYKNK